MCVVNGLSILITGIIVLQGILQTCFDLEDLRGEVFVQLIKQTAGIKEEDSDNDVILRAWQVGLLLSVGATFML